MSESDNNYSSDDEQVSKTHNKLLQAVGNLSKIQHIKKVARKEPSAKQNEFDLVKPRLELPKRILPSKSPVSVVDLVNTLKGTSKHVNVGKELKNVANTGKILPKPMEKPEADRVLRSINYDKTKKQLQRWDAVVAQFQSAESQTFPLDSETVYINTARLKKPLQLSMKSELQVAMEEAEAKLRALKGEKKDEITDADLLNEQMKATKDEIKKRRQELLYMKMRQSQKSAKLRLQNKIKSKKYHRLLKQQKLKEQLKDFETLQKLDPEAALEKLQSLEKNRILERANLRHKNTGTWAKNNLVKARYNRDVQKDLSEQLALSRQLTEKKDVSEDEDEDDEKVDDIVNDNFDNDLNPWMQANGKKSDIKPEDVVEVGYRKYWMERKENEKKLQNHKALLAEDSGIGVEMEEVDPKEVKTIQKSSVQNKVAAKKELQKDKHSIMAKKGDITLKKKKNKSKKKLDSKPVIENGWIVEDVKCEDPEADIHSIDKLFDKAEDAVMEKITNRQKKIQKQLEKQSLRKNKTKTRPKKEKNELKNLEDLKFKKQTIRVDIDEQLLETAKGAKVADIPTVAKPTSGIVPAPKEGPSVDSIKHDNYADVKPKELKASLGELTNCDEDVDFDDDGEHEDEGVAIDRQATINDAFEDDDIMADFGKDKNAEKKALADQITLTMPGWGSWGGTGISQKSNEKKRKLVLDFGKNGKDKADDRNKCRVRINENVDNRKLREHLVSDIPFPFTSVKDYEASIRAPVGRNFVPETAFRVLTKPAVITRRGHIIKPMDESELVKQPKRARSVVEKRILYDAHVANQ
ncbi:U3 small nucleolar RNA-associated protein 14 homolog A [Episyrphus balteatus]|uniref:U3 small nucleolar RNA-associated protein 14 homolog A n=1 Tax=Episyrphus balteatus TaxID=286459 RepID=UPI0024852EF6|nr:U3 small nucleolar RNA-associated protein 14 homolog A [Episyrphus balteatus]